MNLLAKNYIVEGKVQGVGYRTWIAKQAENLGIYGWVCNEFNSSVFVHVEGPKVKLESFYKICLLGPMKSIVRNLRQFPSTCFNCKKFEIRGYNAWYINPVCLPKPSIKEKKMLKLIEKTTDSFINHPKFGDTLAIYNRLLSFYDVALQEMGMVKKEVARFHSFLEQSDDLRLKICSDPVCRSIFDSEISRFYMQHQSPSEIFFELIEALMQIPTSEIEKYSPIEILGFSGTSTQSKERNFWEESVWKPQISESPFFASDYFLKLFKNELAGGVSSEKAVLREISSENTKIIRKGKEVLSIISRELTFDILKHVRVIGILDKESMENSPLGIRPDLCQNVSTHKIPGSIFLSPTPFRHPIHMAEALFHEGLHKKLSNIVSTMLIFRKGFDSTKSKTVEAYWNPDLSWNSNQWSLDRALYALHFYTHNAVYYLVFSGCLSSISIRYEIPSDINLEETYYKSYNRAKYLATELLKYIEEFGEDGKELILWMSEITSYLPERA